MFKKFLYGFLALAILLTAGYGSSRFAAGKTASGAAASEATPTASPAAAAPAPAAAVPTAAPATESPLLSLETGTHPVYMTGDEQGNFHPQAGVTRAEACEALYILLGSPPAGGCAAYADLTQTDACAAAVACLSSLGVLEGSGDFRPNDTITGTELSAWLSHFTAGLPEGLTDAPVTRAAFCTALNRLLGRSCDDAAVLLGGVALYADVSPDDAYFDDVMEASVPHSFTDGGGAEIWDGYVYTPGRYALYGRVYQVDETGALCRNQSGEVFCFGPDGRYTTGDDELDGYVRQALRDCSTPDMSAGEALQAAYLYIKHNFSYINTGEPVEGYETIGWEYDRALSFFRHGGGTCYGFAASFGLLARALGFEAYIISGEVNEYYYPHSWVVIPDENGVNYIYDVELEYARPSRHADLSLFGIQNFDVYTYWYDPWW